MSCAGNKPRPDWSAPQYYHYAKKLFDKEDYFEAVNHFTVVVLRYAGSNVADSAQYYLAQAHFQMEEYLVAASEYEKLINNMSRSPLVPQAQFELAESYYLLSPRAALDQTFTLKAIRAYQNFIEDNPTSTLVAKAEKRIAELRDKLAKKEWLSAEIYRKMRKFRAALIYYDEVLEKYYDTSWADDALYGKIRVHIEQEDYLSASKDIEKFEAQFPVSVLKDKVQELKTKIPAKVSAFNEAPPINPPSISGCLSNSSAFSGFILPPY
jgi:outer membrane protein assembly factor BamD